MDSRKRPIADMYYAVHILELKTDVVVVVVIIMTIHLCIIKVAVSSSSLLLCSSQFYVPL